MRLQKALKGFRPMQPTSEAKAAEDEQSNNN
jgi:hypothetical protein